MNNLLPISPEVSTNLSNLHIRFDLVNRSVSVYFKDWNLWDVSTQEVEITDSLIHFQQSDREICGVKIFSNGGES